MAFLNSLNIVGSALTAERQRTNVVLQNIANQRTPASSEEDAYRRKQVIFQEREQTFDEAMQSVSGGGVRITEIVENDADLNIVYDPTDPNADADGYVYYSNVNNTEEQIDLLEASRAYEANASALAVVKAMAAKALEIGK